MTSDEDLHERISNLAESGNESNDYSDLVDEFQYLLEHPLNLNIATPSDLDKLIFLNEMQKFNLMAYRETYGNFTTLFELQAVEGFDAETIARILPYVCVSGKKQPRKIKPGEVFRYGRNECILRYQRILENQAGYEQTNDSALFASPGSKYLGSPDKFYLKYKFNYYDKIRFGFAAEKDAGEVFLKNSVSDTVRMLVGSKLRNGFDSYSFHLNVSDMGFLKSLSLGDYLVGFGQGLTMWSGLAFGKSAAATDVKRYGRGIRPSSSANENFYFRGIAATCQIKKIGITAFYSGHKVDARLAETETPDDEGVYVESLQETGLHRTLTEIMNKKTISNRVIGGNLNYSGTRFGVGFTAYYSHLSQPLIKDNELYQQFDFSGDENYVGGFDYSWLIHKMNVFGEVSVCRNGAMAQLHGLTASLSPGVVITVLYRDFQKDYQNSFSNPFAQSSGSSNEKGLYAGLTLHLKNNWSITGYTDSYRFPWLKYRVDAPSRGNEYLLRLQHSWAEQGLVYFQFRQKNNRINQSEAESGVTSLSGYQTTNFRIHTEYSVLQGLLLKSRLEYVLYAMPGTPNSTGYLAYQDIGWKNPSGSLGFSLRYALFDTDSYSARMYAYENDVLYSFSVPAYYDKGSRAYLLCQFRISSNLEIWLRISQTGFTHCQTIGTGPDEIKGSHKSEIKVQLRIKV